MGGLGVAADPAHEHSPGYHRGKRPGRGTPVGASPRLSSTGPRLARQGAGTWAAALRSLACQPCIGPSGMLYSSKTLWSSVRYTTCCVRLASRAYVAGSVTAFGPLAS